MALLIECWIDSRPGQKNVAPLQHSCLQNKLKIQMTILTGTLNHTVHGIWNCVSNQEQFTAGATTVYSEIQTDAHLEKQKTPEV